MIEIILSSFNQLFNGIDLFLKSKDLSLGAILAGVSPFIVIYIKISKEKEKKARSLLIERRQLQIAFNVNEILEALKVESKWSLQEIGSTHTVPQMQKKLLSYLPKALIRKRRMIMEKLKSRKLWLTILAALIPIINQEFGLNLDLGSIITIVSAIMAGVAALAHVDAKKVIAGIKDSPLLTMNYNEASIVLQTIHDDINKICADFKKNDGSQAYKDAMQAYAQIKPILDALKHPEPLAVIEDKVAS